VTLYLDPPDDLQKSNHGGLLVLTSLLCLPSCLLALPLLLSQLLPFISHFLPTLHHLHIRQPQDEWLRDQYVVPECYRQAREPTPVIPSSDEEEDDSDDPLDVLKAHAASTAEPTTYRQSQHRSDADLWHTACQEEMEAHSLNGTWEIIKLPPGKHAISSRWFLKVKHCWICNLSQ